MSGPSSSDINPLDYQVSGQCWSLITSCNRTQRQQFSSLKLHFSLFSLPYRRKPLKTLRKTTTSDCRHACYKRWTLQTGGILRSRYKLLYLIKYNLLELIFY